MAIWAVNEVSEIPLHSAYPQMYKMTGPTWGSKYWLYTKYLCFQVDCWADVKYSEWSIIWSKRRTYCAWLVKWGEKGLLNCQELTPQSNKVLITKRRIMFFCYMIYDSCK